MCKNLPTSEQNNLRESCCAHEIRKIIVDSGASLHILNEPTSGDNDTIRRSKEPTTVIMTVDRKAESTKEATVYVNDLNVCHNNAVGRPTSNAISGFLVRTNGLLL